MLFDNYIYKSDLSILDLWKYSNIFFKKCMAITCQTVLNG